MKAPKEGCVTVHKKRPRTFLRVLALILALLLTPVFGSAGEFNISRYIEPNQMSNLFTRHVRKGIIKRIGLTEAQLYEIRDAIDPHRERLLAQITELKDARIDLVEVVAEEPFDPDRVRSTYVAAMSKELDLMLTIGRVVGEIRPILTEDQLREVGEMMEEVRESSEIRFADFAEKLAAGELLGLKNESVPRGK
jgi:Spy/CpxP family protein refolding chaperone